MNYSRRLSKTDFGTLIDEATKQASKGGPASPIPRSMVDVEAALKEVSSKPIDLIQTETATTWAGRAIAAYTLALRSPNRGEMIQWLTEGDEFRTESLEHAAQTQNGPMLVQNLRAQIDPQRQEVLRLVLN